MKGESRSNVCRLGARGAQRILAQRFDKKERLRRGRVAEVVLQPCKALESRKLHSDRGEGKIVVGFISEKSPKCFKNSHEDSQTRSQCSPGWVLVGLFVFGLVATYISATFPVKEVLAR